MTTSKFSISEWLDISLAQLLQCAWVAMVFAFAIWLWPDGVLEMHLADIGFGTALSAVGSLVLLALGIVAVYFVAVVPFLRAYDEFIWEQRD
ncbi:MAG TPA: hypothetical protein VKA16_12590 [Burkholderiales bacterium]|nr:hypothetical protein [Burkholderiales bacterium]